LPDFSFFLNIQRLVDLLDCFIKVSDKLIAVISENHKSIL